MKKTIMKGTHWIRLVLCGFVAGVVWHLVSVVLVFILAPDFVASVQRSAPHPSLGGGFFFAVDLAMGIWAVWLYSAIVPRYGARPTTVAIVGVAWWSLKTLQSAKWAGLGFVALGPALLPLGVATLATAVLASAVGAWLYRKLSESSAERVAAT
ncbi:MAG: hypothetical protein A3H96_02525 [Acidobacteria bacterium RIFCSPLOWO2_02_FULL_67_36]|nr:MAG: hypothetical protein A3H96_02525 [Acidobacteria bacterium RIFCSPLOWO2_02_FULL_67_36]OFW19213.1 MAG: hypothetical protein A3G21_00290 [Acidobacteria bacterium RIFCSPLOWO2_12_FULL_66_21]